MTLMHELRDYSSPKARLTRMIRSGEVIQIRRGLFLDGKVDSYSVKSLAAVIYGPSYISFEYALSYYGLIPERVNVVTSAVYNKNKNRAFHTPAGDFHYYYLPARVFPYGVVRAEENGESYLIATPEKALYDTLYKAKGISSESALDSYLFEDLRMERDSIIGMQKETFHLLTPLYRKKIFPIFLDWFDKAAGNA